MILKTLHALALGHTCGFRPIPPPPHLKVPVHPLQPISWSTTLKPFLLSLGLKKKLIIRLFEDGFFLYRKAHFVTGAMIPYCNYNYVSNLPESLEPPKFIS